MPVEAIHGEADRTAVPRQARELAEAVPGARLTLLPGVGHMAHHAAPEAVLAAVARIEAAAG